MIRFDHGVRSESLQNGWYMTVTGIRNKHNSGQPRAITSSWQKPPSSWTGSVTG
jgi:hypothetical protein